jgi:nucleoid-associated protein YgaU
VLLLRYPIGIGLLCLFLTGCATPESRFRSDAVKLMGEVGQVDYRSRFPDRHQQMQETLQQGEKLFQTGEVTQADQYFEAVIRQGAELQRSLTEQLVREEAEQRLRAAIRQEEERLAAIRQEEERLAAIRQEEEQKALMKVQRAVPQPSPVTVEKEPSRPATYTVKRGETLPQIAARPMIYGDPSLWPLIYRANRDQIRDPRRLWPGQILRIPRNAGKDEMAEARRFAQEKQMP